MLCHMDIEPATMHVPGSDTNALTTWSIFISSVCMFLHPDRGKLSVKLLTGYG